jgi:hypothetical protein
MNYGKITIETDFMLAHADEFIEAFAQIKFLPIVIRNSDRFGMMDYCGLSPNFRDVEKNEVVPEYKIDAFVSVKGTEFTIEAVTK